MADLELQINDTHALLTLPIIDENDETVDLTNASSVTFIVRPEQNDEQTKACSVSSYVDEGTDDGATAGSVLTVSGQDFLTTITVGDRLVITEGNDIGSYIITVVTSDTELTVAETFVGDTAKTWYVTNGEVTVRPDAGMFDVGDQECRAKVTWVDTTISFTITKFIIKGLS